MGVSKSRVTQLFSDYPNITLETLACVFHALNERAEIISPTLRRLLEGTRDEANYAEPTSVEMEYTGQSSPQSATAVEYEVANDDRCAEALAA